MFLYVHSLVERFKYYHFQPWYMEVKKFYQPFLILESLTILNSFANPYLSSTLVQLKLCSCSQMAPKQKIRIKLRSYWVPLIEDSCKQIMEAARTTNAKTMGPVPLPTKKKIFCVLKSPHVHKDARFHFEIRTHQRLIDILYPTAQTIDSLMQLDLPAGVDVEVKLWRGTAAA